MPWQRYVAHISDALPFAVTQEHEYDARTSGRLPLSDLGGDPHESDVNSIRIKSVKPDSVLHRD